MTSTTKTAKTVLISGASIAGPALALWLHRYGFVPTVVERAPELRTGGYKVDIRGTAIEVCRRMGVLDEIRANSTDMRGGSYVDDAGRTIGELPADIFGGRVEEDDEIMRGELARILYDRTREDVEYVFGDSIADIADDPEDTAGVTVTFESGTVRRFDLVVGADGLHSNTRRLAFGPEERFKRHLGAYISIFTAPNHLGLDRWETYHALPGKLLCVYSSAGETDAKNLFIFSSPQELPHDHRDVTAQKRLLTDTFAGDGWEIPRLLGHAAAADDFYLDSMSLVEMDRWSTGRVVLLGDAAHCSSPASGQGTGLALIGAYVLAGELARAGGDHTVAFARYEQHMRPGVEQNQRMAEGFVKEMTVGSKWKIALRMLMVRTLPKTPWKNLIAKKIRDGIQSAANAVPLADYTVPATNAAARPTVTA
ncbi:FAD-dependent monooxygenase [Streptomyces sp. TLI_105]|uniref:FAD-dependent monooxygenase n=1 Tax=Streptomyces sp. TLI_105 TaxID=1881019 RepID=UPI0008998ACA|nr:FAD-dependent monooxygenase [Streptomyces sp. TLI_105]SED15338.1 2-polyprenyl-6-methoxyphenol hydroxylase [Streptomyces sp. TLI_105]